MCKGSWLMWYKCEHNLMLCECKWSVAIFGMKVVLTEWQQLCDSLPTTAFYGTNFWASCAMELILSVLRGKNTDFMWGGLRTKRCTCTHVIKMASGSGATNWSRLSLERNILTHWPAWEIWLPHTCHKDIGNRQRSWRFKSCRQARGSLERNILTHCLA